MSVFREAPRRIRCPRCGQDLEPLASGLGVCARCEGVWLPAATIERAFGTPYWPKGASAWWRRELECPACIVENRGNIMTPILVGQLVVDRCPDHGEWLDAGELGRLLDAPRSVELEAFYELLRPDSELPAALVEFRKARATERDQRAAELELVRKKQEAERARIRAEAEAARQEEEERIARLAKQERRAALERQRGELQRQFEELNRMIEKRERELRGERQQLGQEERALVTQERAVAAQRTRVHEREQALDEVRVRLVELEQAMSAVMAKLRE